jgi:hypothetical protein
MSKWHHKLDQQHSPKSSQFIGDYHLNAWLLIAEALIKRQNSPCGICGDKEEHMQRIVAGCTALAQSEYTNRHNKVAGYIPGPYVNTCGYGLLTSTMNV